MTKPTRDSGAVERSNSSRHKRHRSKTREQRHRSKSRGKSKGPVLRSKSRDQRNKASSKEATKNTKESSTTKFDQTGANPKRLNYLVDHLSHFRYNSTREGMVIEAFQSYRDDTSTSDVTGSWDIDDFMDEGAPDWHELIKSEDWESLLTSIRDAPSKSLKRAISKSQSVQKETLLHRLCYKLPTAMTLEVLEILQHRGVITDMALKIRDASGNTVVHTVCSKITMTKQARSGKKAKNSTRKKLSCQKDISGEESERTASTADLTEWDFPSSNKAPKVDDEQSLPVLDFRVMKLLILMAPELLSTTNAAGDTPLHALVSSPGFCCSIKKKDKKCRTVVLQAEMQAEEALSNILNLLPREIALQANCVGKTVLHYAIAHNTHERVLMRLLRRLPELSSVPDARGMYPLHYIAASVSGEKIPWTFSQQVVKTYPSALVAQTKREGDTPLHALVYTIQQRKHDHDEKRKSKKLSNGSSNSEFYMDRNTTKLAELLAQHLPNDKRHKRSAPCCAMVMFNKEGYTPMHACVVEADTPDRMLRILLQSKTAKKASILQTQRTERNPSSFGSTPLHLALARQITHETQGIIEALVDTAPNACMVQDHIGQVPLAVALQNRDVNSTHLKLLIKRCPEAVDIPRHDKFCPIHLALQSAHVENTVCRTLLQAHGNADKTTIMLMQVTEFGDTPLHLACKRPGASKSLIQLLLVHFHGAKFFRNHKGELPSDICQKVNPQLLEEIPHMGASNNAEDEDKSIQ